MAYTYEYYTAGKRQPKNPFWVIKDQAQHTDLAQTLSIILANFTENLVHYSNGTDAEQAVVEWMLTVPDSNRYGMSDLGDKAGEYNNPLASLSGAVKKITSNGCRPGHSDLSKNQVTNLKKVLKGLAAFDSRLFPEIDWIEIPQTGLGKFTGKLTGNSSTFNSLFSVGQP